jgi:hypothetical protein
MKKIFLLLLVVFSFSSCEKDDICDASTSTTPRLVIEFYESAAPTPILKSVTALGVIAPGYTTGMSFNSSKIMIPLQTNNDTTIFRFIQNGSDNDLTNDNEDILTFNYTRKTVYVSRACGYKMIFNLTNTNINILTPDSDNWIKNIIIIKPNLETENEVHVQIYF